MTRYDTAVDLDPGELRDLLQRIIQAGQDDEPLDGWESRNSPWGVARAIEDSCAERFRLIDNSRSIFSNPTFDAFLFQPVAEAEQVRRRAQRERGIIETVIERARWLDERRARPRSPEPGVLLQICRTAPFAAWGTGAAGGRLELDAIGKAPPGDWRELVAQIPPQLELAGWALAPVELLRAPLPSDIDFQSLWMPPHRVLDVLFNIND
jgi:hypothetical protein